VQHEHSTAGLGSSQSDSKNLRLPGGVVLFLLAQISGGMTPVNSFSLKEANSSSLAFPKLAGISPVKKLSLASNSLRLITPVIKLSRGSIKSTVPVN